MNKKKDNMSKMKLKRYYLRLHILPQLTMKNMLKLRKVSKDFLIVLEEDIKGELKIDNKNNFFKKTFLSIKKWFKLGQEN